MQNLKVGASKIDITPPIGTNIAGYLLKIVSTGIHDPLLAKSLILKKGNNKVGFICCDLLWLEKDYTQKVAKKIEKEVGIPKENLMICCSHTHSGPQTRSDNPIVKREEKYLDSLLSKLVRVVVEANKNLVECKIGIIKGKEDSIGWNSRFKFEDETISWRSPLEGEKVISTGPIDPEVGILFFKDLQDRFVATLYEYSCHANAERYRGMVSADYPGFASNVIEKELGGLALYTRGSCGNIHPKKYGTAGRMGIKLGNEVVKQSKNVSFHSCKTLESIKEEIVLPLRELNPGQMKETDYICEKSYEPNPSEHREVIESLKDYFRRCYRNFQKLREKTDRLSSIIQIIRIENAVLVGIPGEQFVEYGLEIKKRSKYENTFMINLANDSIGYIPTQRAFEEGGYQTWIGPCIIASQAGEIIVEKCLNLIERV